MRAPRWGRATWILVLTILIGCGGEVGDRARKDATAPTSGPTSAGPFPEWLAVFRVEADSNALNADTQAVKEAVGPAVFAGPAACFEGLPVGHIPAPDAYVLGVVATTRAQLDATVELAGREPLFVGRFTTVCVD
jgi:hypothetical protein